MCIRDDGTGPRPGFRTLWRALSASVQIDVDLVAETNLVLALGDLLAGPARRNIGRFSRDTVCQRSVSARTGAPLRRLAG